MVNPIGKSQLNIRQAPTTGACLSGIPRVHSNNLNPSFCRFESEDIDELRPSCIKSGFGKARPCDSNNVKILVCYFAIFADKRKYCFVVEVPPLIGDMLMEFGNFDSCLVPAIASLLATGEFPLGSPEFDLRLPVELGRINRLPIGNHDEGLEAEINPDRGSKGNEWGNIRQLTTEDTVPTICLSLDGNCLSVATERAMHLDLDVSNVQNEKAVLIYPATLRILRKGETAKPALPFEPRVSWFLSIFDSAEEVVKGTIKSPQGCLAGLCVAPNKILVGLPILCQLCRLFPILDTSLLSLIRILSLREGRVVESTMSLKHLIKCKDLLFVGVQSVFEGLNQMLAPNSGCTYYTTFVEDTPFTCRLKAGSTLAQHGSRDNNSPTSW